MPSQRPRLPPSRDTIAKLIDLIHFDHLDVDGACSALGIDKDRLTPNQLQELQSAFRQATSLVRGSLLTALLNDGSEHRLLAQELDKREKQQANWPAQDGQPQVDYSNLSDESLDIINASLQVIKSGNEQPLLDLVNQLVQDRIRLKPRLRLNDGPTQETRNVFRVGSSRSSPPPDRVQKNSSSKNLDDQTPNLPNSNQSNGKSSRTKQSNQSTQTEVFYSGPHPAVGGHFFYDVEEGTISDEVQEEEQKVKEFFRPNITSRWGG